MKLGDHGALTADEARAKALGALGAVQKGEDPLEVIREARKAPTMEELCDEFLKRHSRVHKKPRSIKDDEDLTSLVIKPRLGKIKVAAVTRAEIAKLHSDLHGTPTRANRVLACLSKMFNLSEVWGYRPDGSNPCRHIKRYKENKRKRFLSIDEMARLSVVLANAEAEGSRSFVPCQAIKLLLLTGMRMGEVLTLEWDWVDLDEQRIDLPDSKTGEKVVWLNAGAVEVLNDLREYQARKRTAYAKKGLEWQGGRWVLPGRNNGEPLQWIESFWQRIRKAAKIEDVRIHDLRHTHASIGAAEGLGLPIIGALLGHNQAATTARYAHVAASPALAASELIGQRIQDAMGAAGKIVNMTLKPDGSEEKSVATQ